MPEDLGGPFQLLLDIAARARRGGDDGLTKAHPDWTGVGFSLLGQRFVAPMTEVTEILIPPSVSRLPRVKSWVRGVANVRGRLMPVVDLATFFDGRPTPNWKGHRALVLDVGELYVGLVVDEVHGLKHFAAEAFRGPIDGLSERMLAFTDGAYAGPEGNWVIFSAERLVSDPQFLDAAV